MRASSTVLLFAVTLGLAATSSSDQIYKWTDKNGKVHFSNRPPDDTSAHEKIDLPPSAEPGEGWESTLDRKQGAEKFVGAAESAINSLQAQIIRQRRERRRLEPELRVTQAAIVRARQTNPGDEPALRAREAEQLRRINEIDARIAGAEAQIEKLRLLKAAGKAKSDESAEAPAF